MKNAGRPSKLTDKYLEVAESVLNDDINAIIFTDEELRDLINERLEEEERISDRRWEAWKAGDVKDEAVIEFRRLYKKAINIQKSNLFAKMRDDEKAWQKWAWIIERKFDDWNLRSKQEVKADIVQKVDFTSGSKFAEFMKKENREKESSKTI